jgi:O-antigen/teichoic acid export membrane protein
LKINPLIFNLTNKTNISLTNQSIASRFSSSVVINCLRGGLAFITTLVIARDLGPEEYGTYAFLVGISASITLFLDLGTSNAFQTFICQKERGKTFLFSFAGWQLFQFLLMLLVVGIVFPEALLNKIFLRENKDLVLLALAAVFMQQRAWVTMVKVGESKRLTQKVQLLNLSIVVVHFLLTIGLWVGEVLSVHLLLWLVFIEHLIFLPVAWKALLVVKTEDGVFDGRSVLQEYITYCLPLVFYSFVGCGYDFMDRWLLQNYGGSAQQGIYEVGFRIGVVSLLVTMSFLNIFWKEISEAKEGGDFERMRFLYFKSSRFLFSLGALSAGFLIPWSDEIIGLMLGPSYIESSPVLVAILIYSAFRSLGILNISMMLATSKTKANVFFGSILMIASFPCTYFVLAPKNAYIPGLELGSLGLSIKLVVFSIIYSNCVSWWICQDYGWKFSSIYQLAALGGSLSCGWFSFELVDAINSLVTINLFFKGVLALFLFCGSAGAMFWHMPSVAGISQQEIKNFFSKFTQSS